MSGYIGTQPVPQATQTRDSFTATSGQTSFATGGYTPNFLDVYLNGVKLASADYTATNGSDVVLASGAATGDILEVVAYTAFDTANVTGATNFTVTGAFTSQGIDDNGNATALTIDSNENVLVGMSSSSSTAAGFRVIPNDFMSFTTTSSDAGDRALLLNRQSSDGTLLEFKKANSAVGSIGTNGSTLYIGSKEGSDAHIGFGNQIIRPVTSSGGSRDNAIDLGYNGMRFRDIYLSGGIYLGGVGSANKLDDYEEGSFTPVYAISGGSVTTGTNGGRYVKVGSFVFFTFKLRTTAVSGTGVLSMTLPFATASENRSGGSKGYARDWGVDMPEFSIYTPPNSSVVLFYRHAMNASTAQAVTGSQMGTGSDDNVLEGSIVYKSA